MKRPLTDQDESLGLNSVVVKQFNFTAKSLKKTRRSRKLHKRSRRENNGDDNTENDNNNINYFYLLPYELLVRIFEDIFTSKRCNVYRTPAGSRYCSRYIFDRANNLCLTCRRFNYIINEIILADPDFAEIATFLIKKAPHTRVLSPYREFIWDKSIAEHSRYDYGRMPKLYYKLKCWPRDEEPEHSVWKYEVFDYGKYALPPIENDTGASDYYAQIPILYTKSSKEDVSRVEKRPLFWCDYSEENYCQCRRTRTQLAQCKLKFRYLELSNVDLTTKCLPKCITDHLANFGSVVQLRLYDCLLNSLVFNNILTWLPNIERMLIYLDTCRKDSSDKRSIDKLVNKEGSSWQTLQFLHVKTYHDIDWSYLGILANLPARLVHGEFNASEHNLSFIRNYLHGHKESIQSFRIRLKQVKDELWRECFDGFIFTYRHRHRGRWNEYLEVISSPRLELDSNQIMI